MPLFVFMAGSPFFLKNFMHTLGHFDIYGCAFAICLLLVPARSIAFVMLAALASMILILIHHIHLLMYVPTIAVIVVLRYYLVQGVTRQNVYRRIAGDRGCRRLVFRRAILRIDVGTAGRIRPLSARPDGRSVPDQPAEFSYIWYQPLSQEIHDTWARMPSNILGVPVFALLIWLHAPLWRYFANLIRALSNELHRRVVIAAIIAVSLAYLVMFAIVFDYSRWISNWAVCMFLILHAVKALPAAQVRCRWCQRMTKDNNIFRLDRHDHPARGNRQTVLIDPRSPDPHIERALAAMADMGFLKTDHQRAEFRQAQPLRHLAAQYAALGFGAHFAFAGDDQHECQAIAVGALQEARKRAVGAGLRHAMQVEPGFDLLAAARQLRALAASQRRQRRRPVRFQRAWSIW